MILFSMFLSMPVGEAMGQGIQPIKSFACMQNFLGTIEYHQNISGMFRTTSLSQHGTSESESRRVTDSVRDVPSVYPPTSGINLPKCGNSAERTVTYAHVNVV